MKIFEKKMNWIWKPEQTKPKFKKKKNWLWKPESFSWLKS